MQFLSDHSDTSQDQPQQPEPIQHLANMAGATNHFICTPHLFSTSTPVTNSYVQLPNGTKAQVTHIGQVRLLHHITLHNVLLVPSFSYNLLSASKLTNSGAMALVVLRNLCFIQDLSKWKTIGTARLHAGLFWLLHQPTQEIMSSVSYQQEHGSHSATPPKSNTASFTKNQQDMHMLWHQRLGHPSTSRLKYFDCIASHASSITCTICPLAKMKRTPFPVHTSNSLRPFHLLHVDTWGPLCKT
ncbi:hypothetical protein L6164_028545 [Bauhinia variegata]|uniref:Uncharacterized protein n=1 Tax=Bauhinia variegata TaxID=167791 RepID=A0ACB9L6Z7_BAUVA|nr:hypothetical protein L6164_028545 [Bauhinia variegata]